MTARATRRIAIAAVVVAFLGVSAVVARWLSADGNERARVERLLEAQSRGDGPAMAREIEACDAACRAKLDGLARRLRGTGVVEIVRYDSHTSHALSGKTAPTRVVWQRKGELTTVQCVEVRREGSVLTGPTVTLLGLSAPIGREDGC